MASAYKPASSLQSSSSRQSNSMSPWSSLTNVLSLSKKQQQPSRRATPNASATPTQLVRTSTQVIHPDPTPLETAEQHQKLNIISRDFAYIPRTSSTPPIREFFDPYTALAQHECRIALTRRQLPIDGKVLRRLLDMGWLTSQDQAKWRDIDWAALRSYDKRVEEQGGAYQYSVPKGVSKPGKQEREAMKYGMRNWALLEEMYMAEQAKLRREAARQKPTPSPTPPPPPPSQEEPPASEESSSSQESPPSTLEPPRKRQRTSPLSCKPSPAPFSPSPSPALPSGLVSSPTPLSPSPSISPPTLAPIPVSALRQYPAPMSAYDPAHYDIEDIRRAHQLSPTPTPTQRSTLGYVATNSPSPPPHIPGRGLKRKLSRSLTLSQI